MRVLAIRGDLDLPLWLDGRTRVSLLFECCRSRFRGRSWIAKWQCASWTIADCFGSLGRWITTVVAMGRSVRSSYWMDGDDACLGKVWLTSCIASHADSTILIMAKLWERSTLDPLSQSRLWRVVTIPYFEIWKMSWLLSNVGFRRLR